MVTKGGKDQSKTAHLLRINFVTLPGVTPLENGSELSNYTNHNNSEQLVLIQATICTVCAVFKACAKPSNKMHSCSHGLAKSDRGLMMVLLMRTCSLAQFIPVSGRHSLLSDSLGRMKGD